MQKLTGRNWQVIVGDVIDGLRTLPDDSVQCCVTSPPYWGLRDYGMEGQIGLERTYPEFISRMTDVFLEVRRVLRPDGTCWLNIGDSYATGAGAVGNCPGGGEQGEKWKGYRGDRGDSPKHKGGAVGPMTQANRLPQPGLKPKDLCGIPWRLAFALQDSGWWLRSEIIWAKPNGMPGSQEDRCTSSHETVFMFAKSEKYFSDFDAIKTPPRESSLVRAAQDIQSQAGSHRANGGTRSERPMKTVGVVTDKQRGHSRQHAGFNARWDQMERTEQMSKPAMMRDVWFIAPATFAGAHFAVMPPELARRCIAAGSRTGDIILDPFSGSGTTGMVATEMQREYIGCELNPVYAEISRSRIDSWKKRDAVKAVVPTAGQRPLFE